MAFFECEFPTTLSYRALGGPGFLTTINEGFSGFEQRNRNWANSRGKWTVSLQTPAAFANQRQKFADLLEAFFLVVAGRADAFRLKDHKDYSATAQPIGIGDAHATTFQLAKTYSAGPRSYVRAVKKPIAPPAVDYQNNALPNTVQVYKNAVLQNSGWSVDGTTGLVTFSTAPAAGVVVTADFEFHHPVRFDADELQMQIEESNLADGPFVSWSSIALVEVRL